ncbi:MULTISPECIES: DUF7079 family protein [Pseudomonas]|uniref:DUF7079 domain-containing protein n=1 Tax=Pseudomonas asplenii TaxID=53407 RepID=A0A0M9GFV8_9PSED|nr:hypothetical protein [Pseudomonas fuscovaginae]KPA90164.1 hypothetical protein PF66_03297 [Pseudomonas fuscovaginae]KPA95803.1 hypothetical protein PF70_04173 [Pseudomonas fuscovaginae]
MRSVDTNRLKIWQALSSLFLDTEIDPLTYDAIARAIRESGYSQEEVQRILWNEVFPVLQANLKCVAGEWAGWSDAWLVENLRVVDEPQSRHPRGLVAREIGKCWQNIIRALGKTDTVAGQ